VNQSQAGANRQIARAAGVVMAGMALSSLAGLLTTILVSRAFGTRAELDAFYAANRLSEILFNLMAGGALASAFIPTFTGFLAHGQRRQAWRLASSIANLVLLALSTLSIAAALAAPWLVRNVLAPGFRDPGQIALTVSLLRVMLLSSVIFGLSGLLMGVLNAHQHFAMPALAPASYRLGWIIGLLGLVPRMGIHGLAWGVVLGSALHLAVQLPALRGRRARYFAELGLGNPAVREVGSLMAPRFLGVAVVQINFLVNTIIASGQPEGSLTALNLAFALMIMPQAVIAQAAGIAALPTFSSQVARREMDQMRHSLASTLRGVLFLALPASLGLMVLRRPVISLLLERGAFQAHSTDLVAWALLWYAAGLVGHSLLEVVVRAFYAMKDTRTPVAVGAAAMTLNVIFSIAFAAGFDRLGLPPHGGLALANSTATALECALLLWLLRRRLGGLDLGRLRRGLAAILIASLAMGLALVLWQNVLADRSVWLVGGGGVLVGGAIFWTLALLLGAPEARHLPRLLLSRLSAQPATGDAD
jgi:putative peptidoglycan lipid II flippase